MIYSNEKPNYSVSSLPVFPFFCARKGRLLYPETSFCLWLQSLPKVFWVTQTNGLPLPYHLLFHIFRRVHMFHPLLSPGLFPISWLSIQQFCFFEVLATDLLVTADQTVCNFQIFSKTALKAHHCLWSRLFPDSNPSVTLKYVSSENS